MNETGIGGCGGYRASRRQRHGARPGPVRIQGWIAATNKFGSQRLGLRYRELSAAPDSAAVGIVDPGPLTVITGESAETKVRDSEHWQHRDGNLLRRQRLRPRLAL